MTNYAALIVDVVNSKKFATAERNELQKTILLTVDILNRAFRKVLIKSVGFSSGDEVQGLFCEGVYAYLYFRLLEINLLPRRIRGGVGFGAWTTQIENQGTQAQDGPAYHYARKAIENAKTAKTQRFCFEDGTADTILLNVYLNASSPLLRALSRGQLHVLKMLEVLCPLNYQEALDADALAPLLKDGPRQSGLKLPRNIELSGTLSEPPEDTLTVKNLSEIIAENQHTTRQNVYKLTQKGNLLPIRILDYCAACTLLGRKDAVSHA